MLESPYLGMNMSHIYYLRCGLTQCDIRWQPNQQTALHAEREGVYKKNGLLWRARAQEISVLGAA